MKINVTIEIDDEELKKLFNLKSEEEYPDNRIGEQLAVSQYARIFDDSCEEWTKDPEYNMHFLKDQQDACNDLLKSRAESSMNKRGYLFLNEVYDMLGIPRTKIGTYAGWVYDEKDPIGDNFVDFGIFDTNDDRNFDFINGYKNTAILDFNVDGNILDYI